MGEMGGESPGPDQGPFAGPGLSWGVPQPNGRHTGKAGRQGSILMATWFLALGTAPRQQGGEESRGGGVLLIHSTRVSS